MEKIERPTDLPDEHRRLGDVWVQSASSVVPMRLQKALTTEARVHRGSNPPVNDPSVVLCCADGRGAQEMVHEVRRIRARFPQAAMLVLGSSPDVGLARAVVRAGARGFLHAGMTLRQVARAVSVAVEGEVVLPRELLEDLVAEERGPNLSDLKPRQREVLELVAEGLSNAQVARRLYLSESTVKQHLTAAYKVLGVRNRKQASSVLWRNGSMGNLLEFRRKV